MNEERSRTYKRGKPKVLWHKKTSDTSHEPTKEEKRSKEKRTRENNFRGLPSIEHQGRRDISEGITRVDPSTVVNTRLLMIYI